MSGGSRCGSRKSDCPGIKRAIDHIPNDLGILPSQVASDHKEAVQLQPMSILIRDTEREQKSYQRQT